MRAGADLNADGESPLPSSSGSGSGVSHSPWRSPVPYVFGGLAATLGVIALALLVLACSYYWNLDSGDDDDKPRDADDSRDPAFLEDLILVIMPGDAAPTILAIPIAKRAAADDSSSSSSDRDNQQLSIPVPSPSDNHSEPRSH